MAEVQTNFTAADMLGGAKSVKKTAPKAKAAPAPKPAPEPVVEETNLVEEPVVESPVVEESEEGTSGEF